MKEKNLNYSWHQFPNKGYIEASFPKENLEPIKQEIDFILNNENQCQQNKINEKLAGQIEREYSIQHSKDYIENLMLPLVTEYIKIFSHNKDILTEPGPICLDSCWLNLQRSNEFNPMHNHNGLLSFVLWISLPFTYEEEQLLGPGANSYSNVASTFQFMYLNCIGETCTYTLPADRSYENTVILFPSEMMHCVYLFFLATNIG